MTKVRDCSYKDLDFLVSKVQAFNQRLYEIPLNVDKLEQYIISLIYTDIGVVLRSDKGLIAGILVEDPVRTRTALVETAWYSEGFDGIRLLRAFEDRGRELGADEIRMTHLHSYPKAGELLTRTGYRAIETSHTLTL